MDISYQWRIENHTFYYQFELSGRWIWSQLKSRIYNFYLGSWLGVCPKSFCRVSWFFGGGSWRSDDLCIYFLFIKLFHYFFIIIFGFIYRGGYLPDILFYRSWFSLLLSPLEPSCGNADPNCRMEPIDQNLTHILIDLRSNYLKKNRWMRWSDVWVFSDRWYTLHFIH